MDINYKALYEITVKSQSELDMIPLDFKGRIYIEFGDGLSPAIVRNRYYYSVEAWGNSSVVARGNSSVVALGNSSVVARDNSSVVARGTSSVVAWDNGSVEAWDYSSVVAWENSSVVVRDNSSVEARDNSSVVARDNSSVVARGTSSVVAWDYSSVVAWSYSSVEGNGNSQIVDMLCGGRIKITGNARIVYMPKTIIEYCDFYGLKHNKKIGKFYKCVHKIDGKYFSDNDRSFEYIIGEKAIPDKFDTNKNQDCGHGIHVAHLNWALDYGRYWNDLAIIEVEAKLNDIILPNGHYGKVRCKEVTVIREVPLEECGVYGKILSKRKG